MTEEAQRLQFLQQMYPHAKKVADGIGTTPEIILSRWAGETGWGKRILPNTYNLGNVNETRKGVQGVWADDAGNRRNFRVFQSFDDYANFELGMLKRKYGALQGVKDPYRHAQILKAGGYAEDPNYAEHIGKAMYSSVTKRMPLINKTVTPSGTPALQPVATSIPQMVTPTHTTAQTSTVQTSEVSPIGARLSQAQLEAIMPQYQPPVQLSGIFFKPVQIQEDR